MKLKQLEDEIKTKIATFVADEEIWVDKIVIKRTKKTEWDFLFEVSTFAEDDEQEKFNFSMENKDAA